MLTFLPLFDDPTFVVEGKSGPGKGKHIVLLAGDEEYRSEEMLPQLARILAERHGFKCTVVFSLNDKGEIDPNTQTNQPGIEALKTADLCVMLLRFRRWPDEQMKYFDEYHKAGKPIVALRTSTHAFDFTSGPYANYGWKSKGGFGKGVLGETWVSHWGNHGSQATRGVTVGGNPLIAGLSDVFGTTDVYEAAPPADAKIVLHGEVVEGMEIMDPPAIGKKMTAKGEVQDLNNPKMPIAWTRELGKQKIFVTTMGAATDLTNRGVRRLILNGCFWSLGLGIPRVGNVNLVGDYKPSPFGFNTFKRGVKPYRLLLSIVRGESYTRNVRL